MRYVIAPLFSGSFNVIYFSFGESEAWAAEASGEFKCEWVSPGTFCSSDPHHPTWSPAGPVVVVEGLLLLTVFLSQSSPWHRLPWSATGKCLLAWYQEKGRKAYRGSFEPLDNMQARRLCSLSCLHSVSQWAHTVTSVSLKGCFTSGSSQHPQYLCTGCQRAEGLPEEEEMFRDQ